MKKLEKEIKRIVIVDNSDYKYGLDSNGGCYTYRTSYRKINNNEFEIHYFSSYDGSYCEICGDFHDDCHEEEFRKISNNEMLEILIHHYNNHYNDCYIETIY